MFLYCNSYNLTNYVMGKHGNWTNSPEQREEMLSYDIRNIREREGQVNKEILNEASRSVFVPFVRQCFKNMRKKERTSPRGRGEGEIKQT
jgi:hypothetical protein